MNPLSPTSYPIHVVRGLVKPALEKRGGSGVSGDAGGPAGCGVVSRVAANHPPGAVMALTELQYDYRSRKVT